VFDRHAENKRVLHYTVYFKPTAYFEHSLLYSWLCCI